MANKNKSVPTVHEMPPVTESNGTSNDLEGRQDISTPKHVFPENVPDKLIQLFYKENGSYRALARRLNVSSALIWKFLVKGIEPKDSSLRKKLFLPGKWRKPVPAWVKEATENLARLEGQAQPLQKRVYNRKGERIR